MISIWIFFVMTSFCSYFYLFVSSVSTLFRRKTEKPIVLTAICGGLLFVAGLWRLSTEQIDQLNKTV